MSQDSSAGRQLRDALEAERPLQIVGAINAYSAIMAERVGFRALYLSGGGVANASYGLPDLGMTALGDVLEDVRRITSATSRPLLVDVDTGFAGAFMIGRTVREMVKAGAAGVHIEDQVQEKRCGHRPNKMLVGADEMVARIHAAVDGRTDPNFFLIARTDAVAVEGMAAAVERSIQYMEAGADAIFAEALTDLDEYRRFSSSLSVPILANMTEFGRTPLFTVEELRDAGVSMALYPLSAFRAMSAAALRVYDTIRKDGTQKNVVEEMQTRDELYEVLNYRHYEERLDRLLRKEKRDGR